MAVALTGNHMGEREGQTEVDWLEAAACLSWKTHMEPRMLKPRR